MSVLSLLNLASAKELALLDLRLIPCNASNNFLSYSVIFQDVMHGFVGFADKEADPGAGDNRLPLS